MRKKTETINMELIQYFSSGNYDDLVKLNLPIENVDKKYEVKNELDEKKISSECIITSEYVDELDDEKIKNECLNELDYKEISNNCNSKLEDVNDLNIKNKPEDTLQLESLDEFIDDSEEIEEKNLETPIVLLDTKDTENTKDTKDTKDTEELITPNVIAKTLDICESYSEIPNEIKDGVMVKVPIVLAQVNIPIYINLI